MGGNYRGAQRLRVPFARRLREELDSRGWSQSDFARRLFGTSVVDGREVPKGRDRVSSYLGGALPSAENMKRICKCLDCTAEHLCPGWNQLHATHYKRSFTVMQLDGGLWRVHIEDVLTRRRLEQAQELWGSWEDNE